MGLVGRWCRRLVLIAVLLLAAAIALVWFGLRGEPPPALLPPPADASACESRPPKPVPGRVHLRAGAEFDLVVYGATGFTGKLVAHYLALVPGRFTFAIAGRDWDKLDKLDTEIAKRVKEAGRGREPAAILVSGSEDVDGLQMIVRKARVILAVAGPYTKFGTKLLQVCAQEGTHYADISGEIFWQRKMIEANTAKARFSGAKVVLAAGFDSTPFDLGAMLGLRALDAAAPGGGTVRNASIRAVVTGVRGGVSGGTLAAGRASKETLETGKVPAEWAEDPYLLVPKAPCQVDAVVDGWGKPRYDRNLGITGVPHSGAPIDARIVRRSLELLGRRGVSYGEGMQLSAVPSMLLFAASWGRSMKMQPAVGEGPPPDVQLAGGYEVFFVARDEDSGRTVRVDIRGRGDPGYMHTSRILAEVGLCLLNVSCHRAGMGGGILTPASATDPAALAERLRAARHEDGQPLMEVVVSGGSSEGRAGEL